MGKLIKSIGHGLLAAAIVLIVIYFAGVYLKGTDALRDALDPFALRNYLVFVPLMPACCYFGWATTPLRGVADLRTADVTDNTCKNPARICFFLGGRTQ